MFSQSLRSIENDRGRLGQWSLVAAAVMLALWGAWLVFGRVSLYAISHAARVEVSEQPFEVRSPVGGAVAESDLVLGRRVARGDLLVSLDDGVEKRRLAELEASETGLTRRLRVVTSELRAQQRALTESGRAFDAAEEETTALLALSESRARLAETDAERLETVYDSGLVPEMQWHRASANAEQERAAFAALKQQRRTRRHETMASQREQEARLAQLTAELTRLEADVVLTRARQETAKHELALREIRAPVDGRLAAVVPVVRGGFVAQGQPVASVVPDGTIRVVAEFDAEHAMGRIRAGQTARMRLDAFSWLRFGTVSCEVVEVAAESREGIVRVELSIANALDFAARLEHGLPGIVEIDVDRLSPFDLILRSAGQRLSRIAGRP